jgi:hypothetical protein
VGRADRRRRWPVAALAILGVTALIAAAGLVLARAGGAPVAVPTTPVTTTAPPPPLYAPAVLHASTGCTGFLEAEVVLRWSVSISTFADGYEVYRSTSKEGPFQMVGLVLGRSERRYTDGGLDQNTTYHYVVRATGEGRSSVDAARADVDTPFFCAW